MQKMKIFDLSKEEIESIKKRQIALLVLVPVFLLAVIIVFLIVTTRKTFLLFLILSIVLVILGVIFFIYMLLGKLKTTNTYLLVLRKSENTKSKETYTFVSKNEEIQIKDGLSFHRYYFKKDNEECVFYVLFNKTLDIEINKKVNVSHIDNIALEMEVLDEKNS